jgi:hypothetical protein
MSVSPCPISPNRDAYVTRGEEILVEVGNSKHLGFATREARVFSAGILKDGGIRGDAIWG